MQNSNNCRFPAGHAAEKLRSNGENVSCVHCHALPRTLKHRLAEYQHAGRILSEVLQHRGEVEEAEVDDQAGKFFLLNMAERTSLQADS